MNIIEAIETGKPFKRPIHDDYIIENFEKTTRPGSFLKSFGKKSEPLFYANDLTLFSSFWWTKGQFVEFTKESLLATDWEVKN